MRLRNVKNKEEILNSPSFLIKEPKQYYGTWSSYFGNSNPIHIEIGMGKGKFIREHAKRYPNINFIGIEKFPSVLAAAINKVNKQETKVSNMKLIHYDAIELKNIFAKGEVDHIFLNFSDPWPKNRHAKRRLTSKQFLSVYQDILVSKGEIEFKTDNRGLFEYSLVSLNQYPMDLLYVSLDLHNSPENETNIMTEYEKKFCEKGPIYKLVARYREDG